jgi:hypothetical protein
MRPGVAEAVLLGDLVHAGACGQAELLATLAGGNPPQTSLAFSYVPRSRACCEGCPLGSFGFDYFPDLVCGELCLGCERLALADIEPDFAAVRYFTAAGRVALYGGETRPRSAPIARRRWGW